MQGPAKGSTQINNYSLGQLAMLTIVWGLAGSVKHHQEQLCSVSRGFSQCLRTAQSRVLDLYTQVHTLVLPDMGCKFHDL